MEKITNSALETKKLAREIVKKIKLPAILALYGDLGSGKTTFVTGLAEGLGINHRVLSPTFVIERIYPFGNNQELHHLDLYRLENNTDIDFLDPAVLFKHDNYLVVIEWPEKIERLLPKETLKIKFEHLTGDKRKITLPDLLET